MQRSLLTLILLFPFVSFSQETSKGFTAVGLMGSLDYTNRTLDFSDVNGWVATARDQNEIGNIGFMVYSQVQYKFNNRLRLEGGVGYSNRSYKTKSEDLHWVTNDPDLPVKSRTVHRFKYISLPLNVQYDIYTHNKFRLFAIAGIATNIFLARRTQVQSSLANGNNNDYSFSKRSGYTTFSAIARCGVGLDYQVMKHFTVRIEPYYQRTIRSITVDDHAKEYIYVLGVATGIFYSF